MVCRSWKQLEGYRLDLEWQRGKLLSWTGEYVQCCVEFLQKRIWRFVFFLKILIEPSGNIQSLIFFSFSFSIASFITFLLSLLDFLSIKIIPQSHAARPNVPTYMTWRLAMTVVFLMMGQISTKKKAWNLRNSKRSKADNDNSSEVLTEHA